MQEVVVMAVRAAVMEDPLPSSPFMGRSLGYAHAGGDAQRGEDGGQDGDGRLDDVFPSFFVHGEVILKLVILNFPDRAGSLVGFVLR